MSDFEQVIDEIRSRFSIHKSNFKASNFYWVIKKRKKNRISFGILKWFEAIYPRYVIYFSITMRKEQGEC